MPRCTDIMVSLALVARGALALLVVIFALTAAPAVAEEADAARTEGLELFEKHVRPLLIERCDRCHGSKTQWGSLRLDSSKSLLAGGDTGPAIVPGKPDESELIRRVTETDDDSRMPPVDEGERLSDQQVALLKHWIELGAPWPESLVGEADELAKAHREHWAFQRVKKPTPPDVQDQAWPHTPIDRFILAKLEAEHLRPAPPAERRALIRWATYDLTGLPPTTDEIEAFVSDESPEAYEQLIDRLLASPQYGVKWGRHWLDVARYADSRGYVFPREERLYVHSWPYRDWVIQAFNDDLPYDRFLLLQLAADQVEPNRRESWAALGFVTLNRGFLGSVQDIIDDRIDVVTRGTMALTVTCARCHDHKFDPIPTADYYSLYGVFANSTERLEPIGEPAVRTEEFEHFDRGRKERLAKFEVAVSVAREETERKARQRIADYLMAQYELGSRAGGKLFIMVNEDALSIRISQRWHDYLVERADENDAVFRPWRKFAALDAKLSPEEFARQAATITRELLDDKTSPLHPLVALVFAEPPASMRAVADRYGRLFAEIDRQWQARDAKAMKLSDPEAESLRQVMYGRGSPCVLPNESFASIQRFFSQKTVENLATLQAELERWLIRSRGATPYAMFVTDRDVLTEPRIFRRGSATNPGEVVPRQFLAVVAGENRRPFTQGSGRLEMAQAIVDPSNPLTARVWVNRVWMHHFGKGIVGTPSDFGLRSEPPTHPELLDWLAAEFIEHGWSTKQLHRAIMLSSVYRQSSRGPAEADARQQAARTDPENRLLWRMNPHRLSFEEARDTLLAVSGELDTKLGGRGTPLFQLAGAPNMRRSVYGLIDRQFVPSVYRMFDFANPDMHTPQRSETTVPQQALFVMNHPFVAARARELARLVEEQTDSAQRVGELYRRIYGRDATGEQVTAAEAFVATAKQEPAPEPPVESLVWQYGYGEIHEDSQMFDNFRPLPFYNGAAWQGGNIWPDHELGWVQLTAEGGHAGNDLKHAAVRRWVAPRDATVNVQATAKHELQPGDGVRCWIFSSRQGLLKSATVHNGFERMKIESLEVRAGDTLDFVVDYHANLESDMFRWAPRITEVVAGEAEAAANNEPTWDANRDFNGPQAAMLSPWEQLAQVLLLSNELMFVD